jgi:hypothetical protein
MRWLHGICVSGSLNKIIPILKNNLKLKYTKYGIGYALAHPMRQFHLDEFENNIQTGRP